MYNKIIKAKELINQHIIDTPFNLSSSLSEITGNQIYVKYENRQFTGSFKYRGSLNKLLSLTIEQRKKGIIAMSAGNHAQGLSLGCKLLKIKATIVMPNNTPFEKIRKNIDYGANVIIHGNNVLESEEYVNKMVLKKGLIKIHPFDDYDIIFGQGTLMIEMLKKNPNLKKIYIPVGGGGLISGCAIVAKSINKNIKIIGVETENFPALYNEFYNKKKAFEMNTIAEGVAVNKIGKKNIKIIRKYVDKTILVKESSIERAISTFLLDDKTLVEGAGALGLAAVIENKEKNKNLDIGIIACGGNLDSRVLSSLLMRELVRKKQILTLSIDMEDKPGQLSEISKLCSLEKINILAVEHSRFTLDLSVRAARLNITLETQNKKHALKIINLIEELGFKVREKINN
ncbi:MAG: threonine ammonia-lyase [Rickettsiales bacterium TMED254]|nr:threonine ammonia-lyase [Rickettsiales bacterium]RPF76355.1 MAG: threonine ammonia-lyase [Rickettsiales bacterium TMED254]